MNSDFMLDLKHLKMISTAVVAVAFVACTEQKQTFHVKGVIQELQPDGKTAVIKHEEIPGYMKAMTMPFEVKDAKELIGLKAGDVISFRMVVTKKEGWIEQLTKLSASSPTELPSRQTIRRVRDVEPLNVGDLLPEYHFTNELGQAVSTSQFKGQALALTFIFTSCPFPEFCPRMSNNFEETQKKLVSMPNAPTNWHLLTISFDPEVDTPAVLKAYAQRFQSDPRHWSFLTGDLIEITAITEQFGQQFWREKPTEPISHNLRTVVIDTQGRVQKIISENKWTSDELVAEIVKAAMVKP
ncbi:MAG: SCO family protein [Verrucomicrobia bacterium]|nr:SCO family protein [Verrucomicrobiota bacterium]